MANCNTCGKIISLDADACPNCGSKSNMTWSSWIILIILAICFIFFGLNFIYISYVEPLLPLLIDLGQVLLISILIGCGFIIWSKYRQIIENEFQEKSEKSEKRRKGILVFSDPQSGGGVIQDIETDEVILFSRYEVSDEKLLTGHVNKTVTFEKINDCLKIHAPPE
ncbi:zinc ribbon domain-containing protein [Planktomarina temperata]|nr:zinc ribbon domain-containing protein [Planktomarina temperata]